MPFRRNRSRVWRTTLPGDREVSLGVTNLKVARQLESLRDRLSETSTGDPFLLDCVAAKKTTLLELWQADRAGTMPALLARLNDVDIAAYLGDWQKHLTRRNKPKARQRAVYLRQVEKFRYPDNTIMRSRLTGAEVDAWLDEVGQRGVTSSSTQRRYWAALRSFMRYLMRHQPKALPSDPLAMYEPPLNGRPRRVWYPVADLVRLIDAAPAKYRPLLAFIQGTGADDGIGEDKGVLALTRRDVNPALRRVQVKGEKTRYRTRPVTVDYFAWDAFAVCLERKLPEAKLFPGVTYVGLYHWWRRFSKKMGYEGYRFHDSRHSYAIRHMQLGVDPNAIARSLGHVNPQQVTQNYGVHRSETVDPELRALVFGPTTDVTEKRGKA